MSERRRLRILAVSDQVVEALYSPQAREWLSPIHLILSCGDLPYGYLEFLMELFNAPLFYVHGNHDRPELLSNGRIRHAPEGGAEPGWDGGVGAGPVAERAGGIPALPP